MMTIFTVVLPVWILIFWSTTTVVTGTVQLDFRIIPAVIQPLVTRNVTLQCLVNEIDQYGHHVGYNQKRHRVQQSNSSPEEFKSGLVMIRIVKNMQSQWQAIAQIGSVAPTVTHKLDASVSSTDGVISGDPKLRSFIQVTWDVATSDAFGSYRCDAISFDSQQNSILTTSSLLSPGSSLNALDFLRLLKHDMTSVRMSLSQHRHDERSSHNLTLYLQSEQHAIEKRTELKQKELEEKLSEQSDLMEVVFQQLEKKIDNLESEMTNKMEEVDSKIDVVLDSGFLMLWPRGSYGLLQPQSGCPVGGGTTWESGWGRFHTESTDRNKDELSTESHLKEPVLEKVGGDNFLTQHFCIRTKANLLGPNWPKGSYCINKKENCPDMFNEGYVSWDEEDDVVLGTSGGLILDESINETTTVFYCCRQDGPAEVPIYLPNLVPFYLYRYGGKCQQVHGMNVTEEFVVFDTENINNEDAFGTVHPDGTINNVRLELCYYRSV